MMVRQRVSYSHCMVATSSLESIMGIVSDSTVPSVLGVLLDPSRLSRIPTFSMATMGSEVQCTISSDGAVTSLMALSSEVNDTQAMSLAIPQKLSKKILDLQCVEMLELLPETWGLESDAHPSCCHDGR